MSNESQVGFASRSFWMESAPYEPGPALDGDRRVDVAIVGGGFAGLWTAYHLKRAEQSLEIAVVERDMVGYGASGRNAGFVMTLVARSLDDLAQGYGASEAKAAHQALVDGVDGIGQFCSEHGVDAEYEKNGVLTVSTAPWQDEGIEADVRAAEELGIEGVRFLDGEALREMVRSPIYRCGHEESSSAIVNPAKLAWGIAGVVRQQGVTIYEGTEVTAVRQTSSGAQVRASTGTLSADQAVLATNAYSVQFPHLKRWVIPIYTYIVLTEPLTPAQWESIGWKGRQGIEDRYGGFHYYRPTADGRIVWGGDDYVYHRGSAVGPRFDRDDKVFSGLKASFVATFPQLADVRFTHEWGGPVAITVRFIPTFGTLEGGRIHYGVGYCGHGVGPTFTGGEILRDLVLGRDTELTSLCFVHRRAIPYPPEPLRALVVNSALRHMKDSDRTGRARPLPLLLRLLNFLERRRRASELRRR